MSSIVITLLGKRELATLLSFDLWLVYCLPWFVCTPFVIIGGLCSVTVALTEWLISYWNFVTTFFSPRI